MNSCLITGWSGFLGQSICKELIDVDLITLGRDKLSDIVCDLSECVPKLGSYELVIHAAGKAHFLPRTDEDKKMFFDVNVQGTINLLSGLQESNSFPKTFVFISSVSVYGVESGNLINENSFLGGHDPYALSKIQAEKIVQDWCDKNQITCTIFRLPLLVGANPPGNLGAMINGIEKGFYFNIAGGKAKKSMVLAEDVSRVIINASKIGGVYNLTDGYHPSFLELSRFIASRFGKKEPSNIPLWIARILSNVGDFIGSKFPINSSKLNKIISDLTFDDTLARKKIGWNPKPILTHFEIKHE